MRIVTINIPDQYLDCIQVLVNLGYYPSRSEAVRQALKRFLTEEDKMTTGMNPENFQALKSEQMEAMIHYK
ncbi:MAG: ribbon-helix-helix domain-containing protein [Promethearchaeota archaeon]